MSTNSSAWAKAEQLARRIYHLTTTPMRSENHPTWDPAWRAAINDGLNAIGTGDERRMELALVELDRLSKTL
ncbi:hypothetical protein BH10PSE6_BH10PSE6_15900 [soil metagenome]